MIAIPEGWIAHAGTHGLVLSPADDPRGAIMAYREHSGPWRPFVDIVRAHVASLPTAPAALIRRERFLTVEGEYAALIVMRLAGELVHAAGFVALDDTWAELCLTESRASRFADAGTTVARLLADDRHHLGVRPRRFVHAAPAGWLRTTRASLRTVAYCHPRAQLDLIVPPALPLERAAARVRQGERIIVPWGDGCLRRQLRHDAVCLEAEVVDGTWRYHVAARAPLEDEREARHALLALVASIAPLPRRCAAGDPAAHFEYLVA